MYYFFLGNTPELSLLELSTLYADKFALTAPKIAELDGELDLATLPRLGGTTKVAKSVATIAPKDLESTLSDLIQAESAKNIALTDYADLGFVKPIFHRLKDGVNRSIRFVSLDTKEHELVMLAKQHVAEFNLLPGKNGITIARTVWIYDAEDWISRDRKKPYRDIKRGMLPPKLARLMVNLATEGKTTLTLADPFCGTGTVLMEAMMVGCHVVGGDTNPDAVKGSLSNLSWVLSGSTVTPLPTYSVSLTDATHFSTPVDCIATEPYMGPLLDDRNPSSLEKVKNIARGLDKLYRGALKAWFNILPTGGRVVISLPSFAVYNRVIPTISIDTIAALGYNYISSVAYAKPGAILTRNITILEKN